MVQKTPWANLRWRLRRLFATHKGDLSQYQGGQAERGGCVSRSVLKLKRQALVEPLAVLDLTCV